MWRSDMFLMRSAQQSAQQVVWTGLAFLSRQIVRGYALALLIVVPELSGLQEFGFHSDFAFPVHSKFSEHAGFLDYAACCLSSCRDRSACSENSAVIQHIVRLASAVWQLCIPELE